MYGFKDLETAARELARIVAEHDLLTGVETTDAKGLADYHIGKLAVEFIEQQTETVDTSVR